MEDPRRGEIALFRYGLIREPADPDLTPAQRGRLVRALAASEHRSPDGEWTTVGRSTLDRWIVAYRAGGLTPWSLPNAAASRCSMWSCSTLR